MPRLFNIALLISLLGMSLQVLARPLPKEVSEEADSLSDSTPMSTRTTSLSGDMPSGIPSSVPSSSKSGSSGDKMFQDPLSFAGSLSEEDIAKVLQAAKGGSAGASSSATSSNGVTSAERRQEEGLSISSVPKPSGTSSTATAIITSYPIGQGSEKSDIHGNWVDSANALYFTADADIDCDGSQSDCPGNPDGQAQTNFGKLNTYKVPWSVVPQDLFASQGKQKGKEIPENGLVAVICDNKLFYSIMGDTNGDSPQIIGEVSMALGNACFPNEGLQGDKGHSQSDVLYIPFLGDDAKVDGVGEELIENFGTLKQKGDALMKKLVETL